MRRRGSDDEEKIKARLEIANKEIEQVNLEGFHDKTFVNDDLESTYKSLESYIFGSEAERSSVSVSADGAITDVEMVDDDVQAEAEEQAKDAVTASTEATAAVEMGEATTGAI